MSGKSVIHDPDDDPGEENWENSELFKHRRNAASDAARDEAMGRVDANAAEEWKAVALRAVAWLAKSHDLITCEDVRDALEEYYPGVGVHDMRALGPVMRRAARAGLIHATSDFIKSVRRHSSPIRVWRSRTYPRGRA